MKSRFLYSALAASAALMFTACSQTELGETPAAGGQATVNFAVTAPVGLDTRTFGDGNTATELRYAVYDAEGHQLSQLGNVAANQAPVAMTGRQAEVKLQLVKGNTYKVVFWAESPSAPYQFDWANATMTVKPQALASSNEKGDAFYNVTEVTVTADTQESVTLHRPYAQLNIGTNDLAASKAAGFDPTHTRITLSGVPNTMSLLDGTVSGSTTIGYAPAARPDATSEPFPVEGYEYLCMGYVLMGDKQTADVVLQMGADDQGTDLHSRTFTSVPLQRNYRTNIYGSLLTNEVDYQVTIDPSWEDDYEMYVEAVPVETQEEMVQAISTPGAKVKLAPNTTYTLPQGQSIAEGVTIIGGKDVVVETAASLGQTGYNAEGLNNVTFKNLTMKVGQGNYKGIAHSDNLTYDNCTLIGRTTYNAKHVTYNNCTFKQPESDYNFWSYASNITFNNCIFESAKSCVNVYNEGNQEAGYYVVEFNGCTFRLMGTSTYQALQINANPGRFDVRVNNCTVEGFAHLYNIKGGSVADNLKLTVDGATRSTTDDQVGDL